ncbi:MAG: NAD-dependent epimerase/dehydratase family protein [Betaproteobacteria bacterium]|nr:NAD-dependent epimerase/dehydratase family protein [Betaproteobacteria bacterium]
MIAALTGGTGFIGRALVARLRRAPDIVEIRVLTRREAPEGTRAVRGDLTQAVPAELLAGATVLFHCAGELRREHAMRALHVEGTRRLIDAAAGRVRRWVQLSSVGAYGRRQQEGVVDESTPLAPEGEYERTKADADRLVTAAGAFEAVVLRPSIVFGPGMPNRSLAQLVSAVRRGIYARVGRRPATATYVYVDDVAEALMLCGTSAAARGCYNLSDDRPWDDFVAAIAAALGRGAPKRTIPEAPLRWLARLAQLLPGSPLTEARIDAMTRNVRYPSERIRRELGFAFGVSIEEGLRRYVASLALGA